MELNLNVNGTIALELTVSPEVAVILARATTPINPVDKVSTAKSEAEPAAEPEAKAAKPHQHKAARTTKPKPEPKPEPAAEPEEEPESAETAKEEEPKITLETVREKLTALSRDGKAPLVKALIDSLGAKKLTDIPEEKYPEMMEKAEAIE